MNRIVIWGGRDLGQYVAKQIELYMRRTAKIVMIVDSDSELWSKETEYHLVEPVTQVESIEFDYLLICSRSVDEIVRIAIKEYQIKEEKILFVTSTWPKFDSFFPARKLEQLVFHPIKPNKLTEDLMEEIAKSEGRLNYLGYLYGTDKANILKGTDGSFRFAHDYLRHYESLFRDKNKTYKICEFGCYKGASLRMWKEFFPNAQIVGVDIDNDAKRIQEDRISILIGDSSQSETAKTILNDFGKLNLIIDDASHAWGSIRLTFERMWDVLDTEGIYIIEDINCGAQGAYENCLPVVWDAQSIFKYILDRAEILQYCQDYNPEYNAYHFEHVAPYIRKIEREIDSICLIHGTCIIKKY